jgi:ketosteroid isomerase-like protein
VVRVLERSASMSEHIDLAAHARRTFEAFNRGDAEAVAATYAPDAVMHVAGTNPLSGTYRGHAEIAGQQRRQFELLGSTGSARIEPPEAILASDSRAMIFFRAICEREGKRLDAVFVFAFTAGPDGRWQELWFLPDDQAAYDRFWS